MRFFRPLTGLTAFFALTLLLSVSASAAEATVTTGGSVLRVRSSASSGAAVLDTLPDGKHVEVLGSAENGWYPISIHGRTGYVSADYITLSTGDAVAASSTAASTAASGETFYVKVTASSLNIRAGAGTDYAKVSSLCAGKIVKVLGETNGWYKIADGYILAEYTEHVSDAQAVESLYIRVKEGPLNVRAGAGTSYEKVGTLSTGRCAKVVAVKDGWYQIETGYVSADYVEEVDYETAANSGKGQSIADLALQYVGYSYVYGGQSPSVGFDCSGLTYYVCAQHGFSISRTASAQMQSGVPVSWDALQPGDLVFFKKPGNTSSKPASHVGIYIGNRQFVHASDYGVGVIVSNLSDAYYTVGFVGARRLAT